MERMAEDGLGGLGIVLEFLGWEMLCGWKHGLGPAEVVHAVQRFHGTTVMITATKEKGSRGCYRWR